MGAPVGAVVGIYYDGRELAAGDALQTPTGRLYQVVARRVQKRGRHIGRQYLRCLVADAVRVQLAPGARVLPLHWYRRGRRRGRA